MSSIFLLFLIEQFILSIISRPLQRLTLIIYPSIFFWIAVGVGLWFRKKNILDLDLLVKVASIVVLVFWAISFSLIPLYLPVTAFTKEGSDIDFYQILRLISVSLHHAGWTLIVLILFWTMEKKNRELNRQK